MDQQSGRALTVHQCLAGAPHVGRQFRRARHYLHHHESGKSEERRVRGPIPKSFRAGPTGPNRRLIVPAVAALALVVAVLAVWAARSSPQPVPTPAPSSAPVVPTRTPDPLGADPTLIQTAIPGPIPENRIFELYRDDYLLDSVSFAFDGTDLSFTFQGARGNFQIQASHLVIHEPVRYLD
jgi:hypothetical protein